MPRMIKWAASYFASLPPVFVDGCLYIWIAILTALTAILGSDDAAKYISPEVLFWMKAVVNMCNAAAIALKMFRSTQYAEHVAEKKSTGNTGFFNNPNTGP